MVDQGDGGALELLICVVTSILLGFKFYEFDEFKEA